MGQPQVFPLRLLGLPAHGQGRDGDERADPSAEQGALEDVGPRDLPEGSNGLGGQQESI